MFLLRVVSEPKPIDDKMYGCVVITRAKPHRFLLQTFPVDVAPAICKEEVWHHVRGRDLALSCEDKLLLVKMSSRSSPLDEQEISGYLEFIAREPKQGELDVRSALGITVEEEIQRLRFGGQEDGKEIPDAKVG